MTLIAKPAGETHANTFGPEGAKCLLIEIGDERAFRPFLDLLEKPVARPATSTAAKCLAILRELHPRDALSAVSIESAVLQLLVAESRRRTKPFVRELQWMKRSLEILHANPPTEFSLSSLAAELGVHTVHLARTFKRVHGVSVGGYLRQLRLDRALELLGHSRMSLGEIAAEVGFYDQSHMARLVKRATGSTPSEVRKQARS